MKFDIQSFREEHCWNKKGIQNQKTVQGKVNQKLYRDPRESHLTADKRIF
ncbi:hypothetical protein A2U01_0046251, partial [Trifolium medium]|nr:hypothetical protein [Trifolium medium]